MCQSRGPIWGATYSCGASRSFRGKHRVDLPYRESLEWKDIPKNYDFNTHQNLTNGPRKEGSILLEVVVMLSAQRLQPFQEKPPSEKGHLIELLCLESASARLAETGQATRNWTAGSPCFHLLGQAIWGTKSFLTHTHIYSLTWSPKTVGIPIWTCSEAMQARRSSPESPFCASRVEPKGAPFRPQVAQPTNLAELLRNPFIIHLNIALSMVLSLYFGVEKATCFKWANCIF